jgi:hypothetical protein
MNLANKTLLFSLLLIFSSCQLASEKIADEYRLVWEDTFDSPELNPRCRAPNVIKLNDN